MYKVERGRFFEPEKINNWLNGKGSLVHYSETRITEQTRGNGWDVVAVFRTEV